MDYLPLIIPEESYIIIYGFAVFLGLVFGSFISALSHRLPHGEDFIYTRSYCPKCHHSLGILDLFPLFSWIFNLGKCRYCKAPVSIRYPLTELFTAIIFTLIFHMKGLSIDSLFLMLIAVCLITLSIIDIEYNKASSKIIHTLLLIAMIRWAVLATPTILDMISGTLTAAALSFGARILLLRWKKTEYITIEEVQLAMIAGIYLGLSLYPIFILAMISFTFLLWLLWKPLPFGKHFPIIPAFSLALLLTLLLPPENTLLSFDYNYTLH